VDRIFFSGTPLAEMVEFVKRSYGRPATMRLSRQDLTRGLDDRALAQRLTVLESNAEHSASHLRSTRGSRVVGITGPGGAGKTTLIDELVLRFLKANAHTRLAVLSHDPSALGQGALLGDRATMIYSQDDRVFMR